MLEAIGNTKVKRMQRTERKGGNKGQIRVIRQVTKTERVRAERETRVNMGVGGAK